MIQISHVSEARKRANEKFTKANYDEIKTRVPKGKKATIQNHAESIGESVNAFINRAIDEAMERDNSAYHATTPEKQPAAAEETPQPKVETIEETPTSIKAFTPEARKAVDLKKLSSDIQYQFAIRDTFGMDYLRNY